MEKWTIPKNSILRRVKITPEWLSAFDKLTAEQQNVVMAARDTEEKKILRSHRLDERRFYKITSILGYYNWAIFYFLLGGRMAGKSYAIQEFFVQQWRKFRRPFIWLRITDNSVKNLLSNNCQDLIEPDIRRRYNLEVTHNGDTIYEIEKRDKETGRVLKKSIMGRVKALTTFANDKGRALYDKDFLDDPKMCYNICLDEFQQDKTEKKIVANDIVYNFVNQLENLVRSTKSRIRVFLVGNTLEEASDLLSAFNFIPTEFGRYKLKRKRAIIEYMAPTRAYKEDRKGTIADILMPESSNFTNQLKQDNKLITKQRLVRVSYVIKFAPTEMYTVWDNKVICKYNNETRARIIAMRPYLEEKFITEARDNIMQLYDNRSFLFRSLLIQSKFTKSLKALMPRGNNLR